MFIDLYSMMPHFTRFSVLCSIAFVCVCCKAQPSVLPAIDEKTFNAYWNQGQAELSSYELNQSRYGAQHDGSVVLVFVTEDLSKSLAVKLDDPVKYAADAIKVMKLNMNKEFVTGIYKYSMMSSVYTPLDYEKHPHSLKLTAGSQDWCGQTFMQSNWKNNRYDVQQFSYFESDGDKSFNLRGGWLEDELMTKIRVSPNMLPVGNIQMIPSAFYSRLAHQEYKVYDAVATLKQEGETYSYLIQYPKLKRTMEISFQAVFPYKILGWTETYGNNEVTTAKLSSTIMSDYWEQNHPEDEVLRDELKLNK